MWTSLVYIGGGGSGGGPGSPIPFVSVETEATIGDAVTGNPVSYETVANEPKEDVKSANEGASVAPDTKGNVTDVGPC